jgi:hypothetical protein
MARPPFEAGALQVMVAAWLLAPAEATATTLVGEEGTVLVGEGDGESAGDGDGDGDSETGFTGVMIHCIRRKHSNETLN